MIKTKNKGLRPLIVAGFAILSLIALAINPKSLGKSWTFQTIRVWDAKLCDAIGIWDTDVGKRAHTGLSLECEMGKEDESLVAVGDGGHRAYEVISMPWRKGEAREFMTQIAVKYGWRLEFADGTTFDPRSIRGWEPPDSRAK